MTENRLKFNPKLHAYLLDDKPITGVTTILRVIAKPFLIPWAANMAVDYIKSSKVWELVPNTPRKIMIEDKKFAELLDQARKAHTQKRDDAGNIGKIVHKHCENYIKGEPFITAIPQELKIR